MAFLKETFGAHQHRQTMMMIGCLLAGAAVVLATINTNLLVRPTVDKGLVGWLFFTPSPQEVAESNRLEALRPQSAKFSLEVATWAVSGFGPATSDPAAALDSDQASAWVAINSGDEWRLDLGKVKQATVVVAGGASGTPLSATALESSKDGSEWAALQPDGRFCGRYLRFVLRGEGPAGLSDLQITPS